MRPEVRQRRAQIAGGQADVVEHTSAGRHQRPLGALVGVDEQEDIPGHQARVRLVDLVARVPAGPELHAAVRGRVSAADRRQALQSQHALVPLGGAQRGVAQQVHVVERPRPGPAAARSVRADLHVDAVGGVHVPGRRRHAEELHAQRGDALVVGDQVGAVPAEVPQRSVEVGRRSLRHLLEQQVNVLAAHGGPPRDHRLARGFEGARVEGDGKVGVHHVHVHVVDPRNEWCVLRRNRAGAERQEEPAQRRRG